MAPCAPGPGWRRGGSGGSASCRLVLMSLGAFLLSIGPGLGGGRPAYHRSWRGDAAGQRRGSVARSGHGRDRGAAGHRLRTDDALSRHAAWRCCCRAAAIPPDQAIEAVASDGFVATLPLDLLRRQPGGSGSVPYLAIEPPASPWPKLAGKAVSAGPFYIVWLRPEADGIRTEQWPYEVVEIRASDLPAKRWPVLAVDPKLPAEDPRRAGEALYATMCLVCHRLNGARQRRCGAGSQSADRIRPNISSATRSTPLSAIPLRCAIGPAWRCRASARTPSAIMRSI